MRIGVPKEIKNHEYRVGMVPHSVHELVQAGHEVMVESKAGEGIQASDQQYEAMGATILADAASVYAQADMIVKVKEPQPSEFPLLRENQILFTYLHLAPDPKQTQALVDAGCVAIAYETVTDDHGRLPLLAPMSEVAGRLSIQAGSHSLEKPRGGSGVLLGGVPGVAPGHVVVIGGGVVGSNAIRMAVGEGARVTVLDRSIPCLQALDQQYGSQIETLFSTQASCDEAMASADLVVGAVLIPGGSAPKIIRREILSKMRPGSVIVDVAIDQGGCAETSRPTTHAEPTYVVDSIVHYSVANMPGAVPRTSSYALNNATLPFILNLANKGYHDALLDDPHFMRGLNVCKGKVTYEAVAQALDYDFHDPRELLKR